MKFAFFIFFLILVTYQYYFKKAKDENVSAPTTRATRIMRIPPINQVTPSTEVEPELSLAPIEEAAVKEIEEPQSTQDVASGTGTSDGINRTEWKLDPGSFKAMDTGSQAEGNADIGSHLKPKSDSDTGS
jgi:hypothetical protein